MIPKISKNQLERFITHGSDADLPWLSRIVGRPIHIQRILPRQCSCTAEEFYDYRWRLILQYFLQHFTIADMERYYRHFVF